MKKLIFALALLLALPFCAYADFDLSGMSFDELVALRDQLNLSIWNSAEWQEVTVPQGIWEVGKDIPAGHWTIKAYDGAYSFVKYGYHLDDTGHDIAYPDLVISESIKSPRRSTFEKGSDLEQIDIVAQDGCFFVIDNGDVVFSPYSGKPVLGFK